MSYDNVDINSNIFSKTSWSALKLAEGDMQIDAYNYTTVEGQRPRDSYHRAHRAQVQLEAMVGTWEADQGQR
eukprot:COSAG01_NODE_61434_length_289_cov_1.363158_1_plen_71_part_01